MRPFAGLVMELMGIAAPGIIGMPIRRVVEPKGSAGVFQRVSYHYEG